MEQVPEVPEQEIEDVIAAVNRQSPKTGADGLKAMPMESGPLRVKSPRSQNSQKSLRSGKSRGSIRSKKSQKSMRSQKAGGTVAEMDGQSNDSKQKKSLKERMSEEGAQSAELPA